MIRSEGTAHKGYQSITRARVFDNLGGHLELWTCKIGISFLPFRESRLGGVNECQLSSIMTLVMSIGL